ncbi:MULTISPECIES: hypothetical protein [unclassified Streptomyces]|uniref:hypothetical protein n=1 Tax=unclassified Streptomyces TaxID=2593676 RepID=UPI0022718DA7|nr:MULTISPECIES: hypothetical protein [unclassified Streptomyces]MCY0923447.1 hypothetical protein [Streptomyces sp. H27-G5]MCY0961877.1 hypothetical protein [Streptomyces sp. H27-H5]
MSRPGAGGLRFGMFAVCVTRDPDPGLNKSVAKSLYSLLVSYADVSSRDTSQGYPYRAALAGCLDCSKQTVDRAAAYLEQEIGLVRIHRRKVEGKEEENDANVYEIFDAWLIHGIPAPAGTPPQLVARYGHTIPGFDIDAWMSEHAPDWDLRGWRAAYDAQVREQQAQRAEQRRKENARRKKPKVPKGGGVMGDATPEEGSRQGGSVTGDATGGVMGDAYGGVMGDALSKGVSPDPSSTAQTGVTAVGQSAGGLAPADAREAAAAETSTARGGSAAVPKKRSASKRAVVVSERVPVPGEDEVYAALDALGVLSAPAARIPSLRRSVREFLGHRGAEVRERASFLYPRSVEHAVTRISAGWHRAQGPARSSSAFVGCPRCTPSGCTASRETCDRILRPAGYLQALLDAQDCELPNCELGVLLDTREECRTCDYRTAERITAAKEAQIVDELEADWARQRQHAAERLAADVARDHTAALAEHAGRQQAADIAAETARVREDLRAAFEALNAAATGRPLVPSPLHPAHDEQPVEEDEAPEVEEPAEDQAEDYGDWEQLATGPSAEFRAMREEQGRARLATHGR